ncbi:HAD family phosphatase [Halomonas sp. PR-M31]|uniref:HAD family hydrolase n=1 Tax=Halomonas sp. PR-M31 TaxID=1471202 RepID=UPI000651E8A3|nr:HAD family phosphatase [Halomonas sp. PR-M31]
MLSALLFDLNGTLCDTHNLARATWLEALRPYGIDVDFQFYQEHIRGKPQDEVLANLVPKLDEHERNRLLAVRLKRYKVRVADMGCFPGLLRFLDIARLRGCDLALGSDPPWESARLSLKSLGLADTFDPMVFADDAGGAKPEPYIHQRLLEKLKIGPENALAFEDSPKGVKAAVGAKVHTVALATTHHPKELRDAGAMAVIADFNDPLLYELFYDPERFH